MIHANGRALLRLAQPELARLIATVLDAPDPLEGGAFALFGMRDTAASTVFTLAELIAPEVGEIGWGVRIELVGLKATRTTTGWPVEMPPAMPPALFDRKRSEEHTSELQSLMRISYAVFCLKKKNKQR